jgi:integrase
MRKTLASKLVRGGLSISDVSVILGHSSVATTQNYYASLSPAESSKRAVALLDK